MSGAYIVGVDGSAPSRRAVGWACRIASIDGGQVTLVHVNDPTVAPDRARGASALADAAREARAAHPGLAVHEELLGGPVWRTLATRGSGDDVLVIGSHKTGYLHGRVTGSFAARIALHTRTSLAVVPDLDVRSRVGVVAGIDGGPTATAVAEAAARRAHELVAPLLLVHAGTTHGDTLAVAAATARATAPGIEIQSRTSTRLPADALLDAARSRALLVVGQGSDSSGDAVLGTVLHDVLLNLNAPTLIVR
ncbi:nucleotide-binding universal stress UspA family protein [Diaminobutyricimonas aerilata]|uniref:Nucleotide-binding universal stress UspA family protein n=1 Tax=Diaminobutyricimonas aerilata TaxID=1162967 RepID=A0A2M9CG55_9MICO|nr:universal stress protein [Diaminobutyricimonas aerilata]PJJ70858.1 nucleotide-binding universal stress UspA family protein [Diaminobutyricimonas aerilata]